MCARYTLRTKLSLLVQHFELALDRLPPDFELVPRYNIAPTQEAVIVRLNAQGSRELALARWGLVPGWAKDAKLAHSTINARAETAAAKPVFRSAFKQRRCLVPADGYYEWVADGKLKQPWLFEVEQQPFAFAGLWESWRGGASAASPLETFTILTTGATEQALGIHDRMPVVLARDDYAAWLDPRAEAAMLDRLLAPHGVTGLAARPVNRYVNNSRHEGPACVEAA
jgi:putative SOS response-associated peptidase YedK